MDYNRPNFKSSHTKVDLHLLIVVDHHYDGIIYVLNRKDTMSRTKALKGD